MKISQENWVDELRQPGALQAEALSRLRDLLIKRLSISFNNRPLVDAAFIEDIAQESLLRVMKSLEQFEGRSKFTTWATTIAIRLAFSELRRRHWKDVSLDEMVESQGDFVPSAPEADVAEPTRERMVDVMHRLIREKLTAKQRDALLAELAGVPMEEIGRRMGSNRNAIYKLTHDARKRLRKELEAEGFSEADLLSLRGESQ